MYDSENGINLLHLSEDRLPRRLLKAYWNLSYIQFKYNFASGTSVSERECCAQGGMSGEWKFLFHREDSDADAAFTLGRGVAGKNERGFGQIHLLGDGLHFGIRESTGIGEYSQRVAFERIGSKYVPL